MSEPVGDARVLRGRDLWLGAGQDLLRVGGVRAIKVRSLADHLGLTTGSFYHHFSSMQDYLDGLAAHHPSPARTTALAEWAAAEPRERLALLVASDTHDEVRALDLAMREWAATNVLAAEAVQRSDAIALTFMATAFTDLGHGEHEARLRAELLLAALVSRLAPPWAADAELHTRMLDALV